MALIFLQPPNWTRAILTADGDGNLNPCGKATLHSTYYIVHTQRRYARLTAIMAYSRINDRLVFNIVNELLGISRTLPSQEPDTVTSCDACRDMLNFRIFQITCIKITNFVIPAWFTISGREKLAGLTLNSVDGTSQSHQCAWEWKPRKFWLCRSFWRLVNGSIPLPLSWYPAYYSPRFHSLISSSQVTTELEKLVDNIKASLIKNGSWASTPITNQSR